jgi:hypothetical protein
MNISNILIILKMEKNNNKNFIDKNIQGFFSVISKGIPKLIKRGKIYKFENEILEKHAETFMKVKDKPENVYMLSRPSKHLFNITMISILQEILPKLQTSNRNHNDILSSLLEYSRIFNKIKFDKFKYDEHFYIYFSNYILSVLDFIDETYYGQYYYVLDKIVKNKITSIKKVNRTDMPESLSHLDKIILSAAYQQSMLNVLKGLQKDFPKLMIDLNDVHKNLKSISDTLYNIMYIADIAPDYAQTFGSFFIINTKKFSSLPFLKPTDELYNELSALALVTIIHEVCHVYLRNFIFKINIFSETPCPKDKEDDGLDSGDKLEMELFGKKINEFREMESNFLLNIKNWEMDLEEFKKQFIRNENLSYMPKNNKKQTKTVKREFRGKGKLRCGKQFFNVNDLFRKAFSNDGEDIEVDPIELMAFEKYMGVDNYKGKEEFDSKGLPEIDEVVANENTVSLLKRKRKRPQNKSLDNASFILNKTI